MKKHKKLKITEQLNFPYNYIAELLGAETAKTIHKYFNGNQITFPKEFVKSEVIDLKIVEEYDNGADILELVRKYNLHERTIKRKLKRGSGRNEI